jgi:predicted phage terminase large subunit-like protein
MLHSSDLKAMTAEEVEKALATLTSEELNQLQYNWEFWARPNQLAPDGAWKVWLLNCGRGFGKTRTGTEWVRNQIKSGKTRMAAVGPTKGSVRQVMIDGESGLLSVCHASDKTDAGVHLGKPIWSPTNNTVTWSNGAKVEVFSAEDPERLRGPQFEAAWCDEICAWTRRDETWDMLQFCMRLGKNPQIVVTTTPKPDKLIRKLTAPDMLASGKVVITQGTSYDNADNIDLDALKQYEGTRLGRQELYAEILTEAAGALWNKEMLEQCQAHWIDDPVEFSKSLLRIVVAIDPAVTANKHSDLTGIMVAGLDVNGKAYVLEDATGTFTPEGWASKAIQLYEKYSADRIVAERNQGGDMVRHTLKTVDETIPITLVHASRGKYARAEPVSALYEQGKVFHVKGLMDLEDQMVTWEPLESIGSPDRLDAMVWAITNLLLNNRIQPPLKLIYKPANGFLN